VGLFLPIPRRTTSIRRNTFIGLDKLGSKTQTATTAQTSTPVNSAALQQIYGQVANAAQTPYTPYNGQLVAPVNAQQTAGINNINMAANQAQPYYTQAAGLASGAANPLTAAQIQQYQNPYTQNVVNATQAEFNDQNAQQQNSLKGSAAAQGALGGDRQAVAQAQLAGQQQLTQAPTIANLYANSYNSGLQTAGQQFQQNPLAAASSIAGIGAGAQGAALQGAGAQINAGTLQQQTQQAADTANYGQYQAAQGFPYQSAAFLEQYGLPAALGQGTTSYGNQQTQGPANLAPYLGAGVAGAGLFLKDGGEVEGYAPGGGVGYITSPQGYILGNQGYIPNTSPSNSTFQAPSLSFLKPSSQSSTANPFSGTGSGGTGGLTSSLQNNFGSASFGGGNVLSDDAWGGDKSNPLPGLSASDYGYKVGGLVHAIHEIHKTIKRSRGGAVSANTTPFEGFDDGGVPSFDDRFQPAVDNPFGDLTRGQALMLAAKDGTLAPDTIPGGEPPPAPPQPSPAASPVINPDQPYRLDGTYTGGMNPALRSDASMPGPGGEAPNPMSLPRQITNPDNEPDEQPLSAMGYAGNPMQVAPPAQTATSNSDATPEGHSGLLGLNWSDKTRQALLAAGLGIMASRSPFLGVALGEGGLQGLKNYSESTKQEIEAAEKAAERAQSQQRIDLQAKQIAQNAAQFAKTNALAERREKFNEDKVPAGYEENPDFGKKPDEPKWRPVSGGPQDPTTIEKLTKAKQAGAGLTEAAKDIKARQMINGDMSWATNLGRGAQAGRTLEDVSNRAAEILTEEGGMNSQEAAAHLSQKLQAFKATQTYKTTEARTAAGREANLNLILNATEAAIPAALEASDAVGRTGWVPVNKLIQHGEVIASNPELKRFGMANLQLAEHWARAMNPLGVMRESDRDKALEYLNTADSPATYRAAVDQLHKQILRERDAVRLGSSQASPNAAPGATAPAAAPPAGGAPAVPAPPTNIPPGSAYSPSRKQWRAPDGTIFNADGSKA
jgi:hypothetical protein